MNIDLMKEALSLLDTQYSYAKYEKRNGQIKPVHTYTNERQDAYYQGMRTMLEFILTDGYRDFGSIVRSATHDFK